MFAVMRLSGQSRVLAVAPLVLMAGACVPVQSHVIHEPRFTTGSTRYPPARPGYPATIGVGIAWSDQAPAPTSGYDYMMRFEPESVEPGHVIVQRIAYAGITFKTQLSCGDTAVPFYKLQYEYFKDAPANDAQGKFIDAEQRFVENKAGIVGYVELPRAPPAIPEGENAVDLPDAYLDALPEDDRRRLEADIIQHGTFARWVHSYHYDGCHPDAPGTPCREAHCLDHVAESYHGGERKSMAKRSFGGPGGQW